MIGAIDSDFYRIAGLVPDFFRICSQIDIQPDLKISAPIVLLD